MNKEMLIFGNIEIDKCTFHHPKNRTCINDIDIDQILILIAKIILKLSYCLYASKNVWIYKRFCWKWI